MLTKIKVEIDEFSVRYVCYLYRGNDRFLHYAWKAEIAGNEDLSRRLIVMYYESFRESRQVIKSLNHTSLRGVSAKEFREKTAWIYTCGLINHLKHRHESSKKTIRSKSGGMGENP